MNLRTTDVVVVGGGLAGWMAAVRAQELGADVNMIERARRRPGWGNSMVSGGAVHACLRDPRTTPDELVEMVTAATDGHADPVVVRAWADNAARTIAWIEDHGGDLMTDPAHSHRAKVFDPVRATVPGMQYAGFGLPTFLQRLRTGFLDDGGAIVQPGRARGLTNGATRRWHLTVDTPDGGAELETSNVVLADGGFQASRALLRRYVGTDQVKLRGAATGAGDGLRMGLTVGAEAVNMDGFYGHLLSRDALHDDDLWPYPILDGLAGAGLVVTTAGHRIVDEGDNGVTTTNAVAWSDEPLGCWLVCDRDAWEREGRVGVTPPNPHLLDRGATVIEAPTIPALADRCGIDGAVLEETIAGVRDGRADPARTGSPSLRQAPWYAIPVVAGVTFTLGGLRVDGAARVIGEGTPIPGLHAAGGTMGGLHGGPRAGYAGGLLEAAVFGLLAGETAGRFL